jgi:predicted nucleic acid-binding protein
MFWDASALVPCLVPEMRSHDMTALLAGGITITVWWATRVECVSALERKRRDPVHPLSHYIYTMGRQRLTAILTVADQVEPSTQLQDRAIVYLEQYPLRAADALQLAAAYVAHQPTVVCLDDRLRAVAEVEGFVILP